MHDGYTKEEMERLNIDSFLEHYEGEKGVRYSVSEHSDKPDFVVESADDGSRLGVEVTLAIFDNPDGLSARKHMSRSNTVLPYLEFDKLSDEEKDRLCAKYFGMGHGSPELAEVIGQIVETKCMKAHGYDCSIPLILVVGICRGVFGLSTVKGFVCERLTVPKNNPFSEIWLNSFLCIEEDQNGILQLG